jgi:hypothetical protein
MPELPAACRDHLAAIAPRKVCPVIDESAEAVEAAKAQAMADEQAGVPSRFAEYVGPARSAYIVARSDAARARWAA